VAIFDHCPPRKFHFWCTKVYRSVQKWFSTFNFQLSAFSSPLPRRARKTWCQKVPKGAKRCQKVPKGAKRCQKVPRRRQCQAPGFLADLACIPSPSRDKTAPFLPRFCATTPRAFVPSSRLVILSQSGSARCLSGARQEHYKRQPSCSTAGLIRHHVNKSLSNDNSRTVNPAAVRYLGAGIEEDLRAWFVGLRASNSAKQI
jgi:hypothetical protein